MKIISISSLISIFLGLTILIFVYIIGTFYGYRIGKSETLENNSKNRIKIRKSLHNFGYNDWYQYIIEENGYTHELAHDCLILEIRKTDICKDEEDN